MTATRAVVSPLARFDDGDHLALTGTVVAVQKASDGPYLTGVLATDGGPVPFLVPPLYAAAYLPLLQGQGNARVRLTGRVDTRHRTFDRDAAPRLNVQTAEPA